MVLVNHKFRLMVRRSINFPWLPGVKVKVVVPFAGRIPFKQVICSPLEAIYFEARFDCWNRIDSHPYPSSSLPRQVSGSWQSISTGATSALCGTATTIRVIILPEDWPPINPAILDRKVR